MKRGIWIALAAALAMAGCDSSTGSQMGAAAKLVVGGESDYTIKISGTNGLKVSGGYMVIKADGSSTQKTVDMRIPSELQVRGQMVSVSFQKQSERGQLVVTILRDGQPVSSTDTDAAYGVAAVATQ